MKVISSESFQRIEPLIPENHVNVHARIRMWLKADESELFAFPDFPSANSGQWCADVNGALKDFTEASPTEKEEIALFLENGKAAIIPKLAKLSYAASLFRVPSEKQIFWYRDNDGRVRVILAQWGFKQANTQGNVDIIDVIIGMPRVMTQTEVNLHVTYSDGKPAANATFTRFMFNNQQEFTTDGNGVKCFGMMPNGQRFSVSDRNGRSCEFVVEKDKNDYRISFDYRTSCQVTVVNQFDEPMPGCHITIDGSPYTTDENGKVVIEDILLTPSSRIVVGCAERSSQEFSLSRDADRNRFVYKIIVEQQDDNTEAEVEEEIYTSYAVKVVNQNEEAQPYFPLIIDGKQVITDQDGFVAVENVLWDEDKQITVADEDGGEQKYTLHRDADLNHFVYHVLEKMVRIRVLDYDGSPLDNIMVYVDTKKGSTLSGMSDSDGYVLFPASAFVDGKKAKVHFKVPKEYREKRDKQKRNK